MLKFIVGEEYKSFYNDTIQNVSITIAKVTDKTVTDTNGNRYKLHTFWNSKNTVNNGKLYIKPLGCQYSNKIFADQTIK